MHELSLAQSMIEQLEEALAKEADQPRIILIELEIGAMSGVERDAFEFVFPFAAEGTVAEGAKLSFDEVPLELRCNACKESYISDEPIMMCRACASTDVTIVRGKDFRIKSMEVS